MCVGIVDLVKIMERIAPPDIAEEWDNVGLLIGDSCKRVQRVLVSLDITGAVVKEAIDRDIDIIISHHPVIFEPKMSIGQSIEDKNIICPLIKSEIAVYSAHTNLDKADGGVDDTLASLLELEDQKVLDDTTQLGRIGRMNQSMTVSEYAEMVAKRLDAEDLYIVGDRERRVETVASCAGAGGGFVRYAAEAGADVFVTGESKYHESLLAIEFGMPIILAGHYETEAPAMDRLIMHLQKELNALEYNIEVLSSRAQYKTERTL